MRLIATEWLVLAVLALAACERAPDPRFAELTTAESASLKAIFDGIRTASRDSFEREDWSALARLYPAGALACWNTAGEQHGYGFLSIRPIPDSAGYEVWPLGEYDYGDADTTNMHATHLMKITYEYSYPSVCEPPVAHRWREPHYFLRREGGVFRLTHYCPSREGLQRAGSIAKYWPMLSTSQAHEIVDAMTQDEQEKYRGIVRTDRAAGRSLSEIGRRYSIGWNEADLVLELLCTTGGNDSAEPGAS